jgi:hypothetical protein
MLALIEAGFRVALYGGYWDKYPGTRASALGHASAAVVRKAVGGARIALCLVRRANRDGHSMRSLELAAMGGCILAEDTAEHREILGPPGECALYFTTVPEMTEGARRMVGDEDLRRRLSSAVRARIVAGGNSYSDRLRTMLSAVRA